eukprot:9489970-Pyramimonas_sp.AAC.1
MKIKRPVFLGLVYNSYSSGGEAWLPTQSLYDQIDRFVQSHGRVLLMGGASVKEYDDQRTLVKCRTLSNEQ